MRKVLFIFGTRPEAIKLAPLVKVFKQNKNFKTLVCVTAQHRQMLDQILKTFGLKPDYDLNIMTKNQTLSELSAQILNKIEKVLTRENPEFVFVQGDTTTTFISALAAFYKKLKICHLEAGLRTNHKYAPFPEEINRKMTTVLADYHFAPTKEAAANLAKEGVSKAKIFVVGNTVIDALLAVVNKIKAYQPGKFKQLKKINFGKKIILVTGHRRENFGRGFENICRALKQLAEKHPETEIVYPVHLNPNVKKPVFAILGKIKNVKLIEPLAYTDFVFLMHKAYLIITDSGGVQEEAPSLGKPVLVMREATERPEAVKAGTVILVGTDSRKIAKYVEELLLGQALYKKMSKAHNPYGDGKTASRILKIILNNK